MRRRLLGVVLALFVLTGLILVLPVVTRSTPAPHPVPTSSAVVAMGSVESPAPAAEVRHGSAAPMTGTSSAAPVLRVERVHTHPFSAVGVTWRNDPAVTDTLVQVRVQRANGSWGAWSTISTDPEDTDAGPARPGVRGGTVPFWTGLSIGVQAELTTRSGAHPVDVQLDLIDPGASPADSSVAGSATATSTAHGATTMPVVHSRADWGADPRLMTWPPEYAPTIKAAALHHTDDTNDYTADQVPAMIRAIYQFHAVDRAWGDIGYNVLADKFGGLWEGRVGGLSSTVIGAHTGGFNTNTFGISILGNYDVADTPPVMLAAVEKFIGWKFSLYGVDPTGTTTLISGGGGTDKWPVGAAVPLPTVFGHRDTGNTACPGQYGYARLPEIRQAVAGVLGSAPGLVNARYLADPVARGLLGTQVGSTARLPDGKGAYATFQNGAIYATLSTGAQVLRGALLDKWASLGWERGPLGYPTSDVTPTPDGQGFYAHFQGGSIYWSAATGAHTVMGAVRDRWAATGWEGGALGYPSSDQTVGADGRSQFVHFTGGSIYWSPATGAAITSGPIAARWAAAGAEASSLGLPVTDVQSTPDGVGRFQHYQSGSIYWTAATGARVLPTPIRDAWGATGWEGGPLGYPTSDPTSIAGGQSVTFEHGVVDASGPTGAHPVTGAVLTAYQAAGGEGGTLGLPQSDVGTTPDGKATYQHFQGGSVYVHATLGAHVLPAVVRAAWGATGWETGLLGYPTSEAQSVPGAGVVSFQRGEIAYSPSTGAHPVTGALLAAYQTAGADGGLLGMPVSDAGTTPDGKATYQHFSGGSIYVTSAHGARVIPVAIRNGWAASGWERGPFGYPAGDATATTDGRGTVQAFDGGEIYASPTTGGHGIGSALLPAYRSAGGAGGDLGLPVTDTGRTPDRIAVYQHFEGGSIYSTASTGARAVSGAIRAAWAASGWEKGALGYPSGNAVQLPDGVGRYQQFQKGVMYWSPSTGAHIVQGAVYDAWAATGWEWGPLGYPTSDSQLARGGRTTFQHGVITISATDGKAIITTG